MATTNLNIRMDKEIKEQADTIFAELGMNMTTAINLFLRTAIREQGIPFSLIIPLHVGKGHTESRIADAEFLLAMWTAT